MHLLEHWIANNVRAVYSPYHEMLVSLHVLVNPEHHLSRLEWARKIRQTMDKEMLEQILFYGNASDEWFFAMDCEDAFCAESRYPEESIEQWALIDEGTFCCSILGNYRERRARLNRAAREILRRPRWHQKQLYHLLQAYQKDFFARELYTIEPWLVRSVKLCNNGFRKNPVETLQSIHPRFRVEEKGIKFLKSETYAFAYSELESITILPSTFVAPHLLIDIEQPGLIKVNKQVVIPSLKSEEQVPRDLLRKLQALDDPTRLVMVQAMLYQPYCTQQLTERFGLAKATISKHLKILEASGLLQSERSGHYVFYHTNAPVLEMIRVDLDQFFDQPKLDRGESH